MGPPGLAPVARGQWSGGRGGVRGWSQVAGCLPDNLQGHGGAGELGQGVGQGAGGCPQFPQVGHGVYHAAQEEDQEVHPGDEGVRPEEAVDKAQEQEGVDGLHVVPVGSDKAKGCGQPGVSFENVLDAGTLCPQRPCIPGNHLWGARLTPIVAGTRRYPKGRGGP